MRGAYRRRFDGARGGQISRFVEEIPSALLVREDRGASSPRARRLERRGGAETYTAGARTTSRRSALGHDGSRRAPRSSCRPRCARTAASASACTTDVRQRRRRRGGGGRVELKYTVRFGTKIKKVLARS